MKRAEYPQRLCKEAVWSVQAYYCELPQGHPGPCASLSVKQSADARDAWEERNPDWEQRIRGTDDII